MKLECSCQCGAVRFSADSQTAYPYQRCYCSICRKTGGGGGYAINLMAKAATLVVTGGDNKRVFHAFVDDKQSKAERHFCVQCGSALYLYDPRWPTLVHPIASAIDTTLPTPPEIVHIMLDFKADWVKIPSGPGHVHFARYPELSIEAWHRQHGIYEE